MKKRTVFAAVLAVMMLLSGGMVFGGGGAEETGQEGASGKPFDGYELNILMEAVPETDYILELLPEFEDQTGMTVNVEVVNFNVMYDRLVTQLIGPEGSGSDDVMQVSNEWSYEFGTAGWITPLDSYLGNSDIDRSEYVPAIWDGLNNVDSQTYYVPFYHWSMGWIYRDDLMADPELAAEYKNEFGRPLEKPSTLDELLEWQQFMTRDLDGDAELEYGNVLQGSSPQNVPEFLLYLWANDCTIENIESGCGIEALEAYKEAFGNAPPGTAGMQFDQVNEVFIQGNAVSAIAYLWQQGILEQPGSQAEGKTVLTTFPGEVSFLGAWGWAIPKSAPNPDAGWAFIEWVESARIARARAEKGGEPARFDILEDEELRNQFPQWETHYAILTNANDYPRPLRSEAALDVVGRALSRMVVDEITPRETAAIIAEDVAERSSQ